MFKLRLISALILIPVVALAILQMPKVYLALISGLVFIFAAWEWIQMTVIKKLWIQIFLLTTLVIVAWSMLANGFNLHWLYGLSLVWWLLAFVGVCYFPRGSMLWQFMFVQPLVGLLMFVPAWVAFNSLQIMGIEGRIWVLLGCVLIWSADIGAYATGKLWGKRKLIPAVSPGKTWAGLYGAFASGCIVALVFYYGVGPLLSLPKVLVLALITVVFAVIGDLVESMLKRIYSYKDSGNIIPGHGGMYDRLDSMLAAFPIYTLMLQLLQNIDIMTVL